MSKFGDKFLDMMHLNNDYEDDYEDDYNEDDYEDDDRPARSYKRRSKADTYEDEDAFEQEKPVKNTKGKNSSKVDPMRTGRSGMEVCIIKPTSVEESREVTDTLLSGRAVILNLEGIDVSVAQRVIDFSSGTCYAMGGSLQKVSDYIFILTPSSVGITGEYQEIIDGAFMSSIQTEY